MKVLILLVGSVGLAMAAASTSHDAPVEFESRSVHAFFRTDTLVNRLLFPNDPQQILQHTHDREHRMQLYHHGQSLRQFTISGTDEIHFRLTGPRRFLGLFPGRFLGFMTVKPKDIPGISGLVGAHAAKVNETSTRCQSMSGADFAACVAAGLIGPNAESPNLVWVVAAPQGFTWLPVNTTDADVANNILKAAQAPSHAAARSLATTVEYLLRAPGNNSNIVLDRFFIVPKNGTPNGSGIEMHTGWRLGVCETRKDTDDGTPASFVCPVP